MNEEEELQKMKVGSGAVKERKTDTEKIYIPVEGRWPRKTCIVMVMNDPGRAV